MSIIRLPIDIKSFYFNIKNDNETGHTPTVATPLKQGVSVRPELEKIYDIPEDINPISRENLVSSLLSKSRVQAKIDKVYVFDKIAVNWNTIETGCSFCFYIREETDPKNVHCGRLKLHYPQSLIYSDENVEINNKHVVKCISETLKSYAFIIEGFEYDTESGVLNFDSIIVGENDIPYSKVFINRRGVGNKFSSAFTYESNRYDTEIIALREKLGYDKVFPENYCEVISNNDFIARNVVYNLLLDTGANNIRILKDEYPYSLYDIEYWKDGKKNYSFVQQTATKEKSFVISTEKVKFLNDFPFNTCLFLVTDICESKKVEIYSTEKINEIEKSIASIRFTDRK